MDSGFYKELYELCLEDPCADFGFLESIKVTPDKNAYNFLHGFCHEFAAMLSELYGYEIVCVRHAEEDGFDGKLIHAYCVSQILGEPAFIDIRGITTDAELFYREFENEVTFYPQDYELWDLEGPAVLECWPNKDTLFDGDYEGWTDEDIRNFILSYDGYFNIERAFMRSKETQIPACDVSVHEVKPLRKKTVTLSKSNQIQNIRKDESTVREWLKGLDEIDLDCISKWEFLLNRELKSYDEYVRIDSHLDEMVLEYESRKDFFKQHPEFMEYTRDSISEKLFSLDEKIQAAQHRLSQPAKQSSSRASEFDM